MLFKELIPTKNEFETIIYNPIKATFLTAPFFNSTYVNTDKLFFTLSNKYNNRLLRYDADEFVGYFQNTLLQGLEQLYIKGSAWLDNNIELSLKDDKKRGSIKESILSGITNTAQSQDGIGNTAAPLTNTDFVAGRQRQATDSTNQENDSNYIDNLRNLFNEHFTSMWSDFLHSFNELFTQIATTKNGNANLYDLIHKLILLLDAKANKIFDNLTLPEALQSIISPIAGNGLKVDASNKLYAGSAAPSKTEIYAALTSILQNGNYTTLSNNQALEQIKTDIDIAALFSLITVEGGIHKRDADLGDGIVLSTEIPEIIVLDDIVVDGRAVYDHIQPTDIGKLVIIHNPALIGWFGNPDFVGAIVQRDDTAISVKGHIANNDFDYITITFNNDDNVGTAEFTSNKFGSGLNRSDGTYPATVDDVKTLIPQGLPFTFTKTDTTITITYQSPNDDQNKFTITVNDETPLSKGVILGIVNNTGQYVEVKPASVKIGRPTESNIEFTNTQATYTPTTGAAITKDYPSLFAGGGSVPKWVDKDIHNINVRSWRGKPAIVNYAGVEYVGGFDDYGFYSNNMTGLSLASPDTISVQRFYMEIQPGVVDLATTGIKMMRQNESYTDPAKPQRTITNTIVRYRPDMTIQIWE